MQRTELLNILLSEQHISPSLAKLYVHVLPKQDKSGVFVRLIKYFFCEGFRVFSKFFDPVVGVHVAGLEVGWGGEGLVVDDFFPESGVHGEFHDLGGEDGIADQNSEEVKHFLLFFCILALPAVGIEEVAVAHFAGFIFSVAGWNEYRQRLSQYLLAYF